MKDPLRTYSPARKTLWQRRIIRLAYRADDSARLHAEAQPRKLAASMPLRNSMHSQIYSLSLGNRDGNCTHTGSVTNLNGSVLHIIFSMQQIR